jgi:hypothetical protein
MLPAVAVAVALPPRSIEYWLYEAWYNPDDFDPNSVAYPDPEPILDAV